MADASSPPRPNSSKQATDSAISLMDDDNLMLNIKDEEAEIARLELPETDHQRSMGEGNTIASTTTPVDDDRIPKIPFLCSACDMQEMVHYYGKSPPFVYSVKFLEDTFVMRDPFQPPPSRWKPKPEYFVALGANCSLCHNTVCKDLECSFYYTCTYCLHCAQRNMSSFPVEAQLKLQKQLTAK